MKSSIYSNFQMAEQLLYKPSGLIVANIQKELESAEYGALDFDLNGRSCKFREGKITPKKAGFFVTLWKRIGTSPILPYDLSDSANFYIFSVRTHNNFGQFIFPKTVLCEKGILSKKGEGGKRALRVYPPWVLPSNLQAKSTQSWQAEYYCEIQTNSPADSLRVKQLFL